MTARYDPLRREDLTPEHQEVWDGIAKPRNGRVPAPFQVLLTSPELCRLTGDLGAFCRYRTGLPPRLSELVILTVARFWNCEYEFTVHSAEARKAQVPEHEIAALKDGRRPAFTEESADLVHRFTSELLERRDVSDKTYDDAVGRFGRKTTLELSGMIGYYTHLALIMLTHRVPGVVDKA
jgi:4-carboxymuconolactone decarboxylase